MIRRYFCNAVDVITNPLLIIESMKNLERQSLYQVESVQGTKVDEKGKRFYLVKWKNWQDKFNTWQPLNHLSTVKSLIQEFENRTEKQTESIEGADNDEAKVKLSPKIIKKKHNRTPKIKAPEEKQKAEKKEKENVSKQTRRVEEHIKKKRGRPFKPFKELAIKRKPGRPKKQPLSPEEALKDAQRKRQKQALRAKLKRLIKKEQAQKNKKQQHLNSNKQEGNLQKQNQQIAVNEQQQDKKSQKNLLVKRKQIRKPRTKRIKTQENVIVNIQQKNKQIQIIGDIPIEVQKQVEQNQHYQEDEEQSAFGIQQVLLRCKNYTQVKVSFKQNTFFYEVPYKCNGQQNSIVLTSEEIIKVNPKWFEGFFQGFYL